MPATLNSSYRRSLAETSFFALSAGQFVNLDTNTGSSVHIAAYSSTTADITPSGISLFRSILVGGGGEGRTPTPFGTGS